MFMSKAGFDWRSVCRLGLVGVLLLLLVAGSASADPGVPPVMSYQGELRDAEGNPVDGTYTMTFTIYDAATDGNALWSETQAVEVRGGLFSVMLGSVNPLGKEVFEGGERWLGVKVGSDPEMVPRLRLGSAAYALSAGTLPAGAVISGDVENVLIVRHTGGGGMGARSVAWWGSSGVYGDTESSDDFAAGVRGFAVATSGMTYGVYGETRSSTDYAAGVRGWAAAYSGKTYGVYGGTHSIEPEAAGVYGEAVAYSGKTYGVHGETWSSTDGAAGVKGEATSSFGMTYGVYGETNNSTSGAAGVKGEATSGFGMTYGVHGETKSSTDYTAGVKGEATAIAGKTYGVYGETKSSTDYTAGVKGEATAITGMTYGVYGVTKSNTDYAAGMKGEATATSGKTYGVYGKTDSSTDGATGVTGWAAAKSGQTYGVYGMTDSGTDGAAGVVGWADAKSGQTYGVYGKTNSSTDGAAGVVGWADASSGVTYGVYGVTKSTGGPFEVAAGVKGLATATSGAAYGGYFESKSTDGIGVKGYASADSGWTYGVYGETKSSDDGAAGVIGWADASSGKTYGVHGVTDSGDTDAAAIYGETSTAASGGRFESDSGTAVYLKSDSGDIIQGYNAGQLVFKVSNEGNVYADGQYLSPAADFAEMLPGEEDMEPGDVLAVGPDGKVVRAGAGGVAAIIGVYSTKPAFIGGASLEGGGEGLVPVAVVGVVPVKVTAENGPIRPNDLLTLSRTPGYAAKAVPLFVLDSGEGVYAGGTILGRALEGLESGEGVIRVLLQLR